MQVLCAISGLNVPSIVTCIPATIIAYSYVHSLCCLAASFVALYSVCGGGYGNADSEQVT